MESLYRGHRFPPEIISHAVWLYHRFTLSYQMKVLGLTPALQPSGVPRRRSRLVIDRWSLLLRNIAAHLPHLLGRIASRGFWEFQLIGGNELIKG